MRGQSKPWTAADLRIAESLRVTLLEVILQLADLAARERRAAQERQEFLIAELNHRVRNILGLVRGLITQSKDTAAKSRRIRQRAGRPHPGAGARARPDHRLELGAGRVRVAGGVRGRRLSRLARRAVRLAGPDVPLDPKAFSTLALVVHELMTNSAKYGALADSTARSRSCGRSIRARAWSSTGARAAGRR